MQDELPTRLLWSFPLLQEPTESTKAAPPARLKLPQQNSSVPSTARRAAAPIFHRQLGVGAEEKGEVCVCDTFSCFIQHSM